MEKYYSQSIPIVNDTNIKNFVNQVVCIYGKVNSVNNSTLFMTMNNKTSSDIVVKSFKGAAQINKMVKVIGKVYPDCSLEFYELFQLDDEFDLDLLNSIVPIIHHSEVSGMFY